MSPEIDFAKVRQQKTGATQHPNGDLEEHVLLQGGYFASSTSQETKLLWTMKREIHPCQILKYGIGCGNGHHTHATTLLKFVDETIL